MFKDFLRLNVGQIALLELFPEDLVLYTVAGSPFRKLPYRRIDHQYRAVTVPTERWAIHLPDVERLSPELMRRHRQLISVAAKAKRVSPFKKSHSPGVVVALARLAEGQLPQPEYSVASDASPPGESAWSDNRGSLFGTSEQNAVVEQAAVNLVTRRMEADGWVVESVEGGRCGYDLHCSRGKQERHVEVKGTRNAPIKFLMTAGEVRRADTDSCFVLVLVGNALAESPSVEEWPGRSLKKTFQLEPLQYVVRRSPT